MDDIQTIVQMLEVLKSYDFELGLIPYIGTNINNIKRLYRPKGEYSDYSDYEAAYHSGVEKQIIHELELWYKMTKEIGDARTAIIFYDELRTMSDEPPF